MWIIDCVWCADNGEWFERLFESLLLWIVQCYENGDILFISVNKSFALFWHMVVKSVMCIEKEWEKRMYHFEGRIARRDGYYITRDVSRAAMDTIFRGTYRAPRWLLLSRVVSCAATDAWTNMSPMGPGLRDNGCVSLGQTCIIILDIALHILIISELDIVFCWSSDCLSAELVIDQYWACYCGYIIFWSILVEDM